MFVWPEWRWGSELIVSTCDRVSVCMAAAYQPPRWIPAFINAGPRQAHIFPCLHETKTHLAYFEFPCPPLQTLSCLLECVYKEATHILSFVALEEVMPVLLWRWTSKRSGRQSWASRGQKLVNGGDLSSNSPSGGTLGLISEVLKVGFYGECMPWSPFCFTCFFHYTEANCNDNKEVNTLNSGR